jgi:hypothetical protein
VLDVGGGAGVYALPLAAQGYQVHLVDPVALHVEQALGASAEQPAAPLASATVGDARRPFTSGPTWFTASLLPARACRCHTGW